jgi:hypothetical protein
MCKIILGIQILVWNIGYNMFGDFGTIMVAVFTYILCSITHVLALKAGKFLKIWKIDPNIEIKDTKARDMEKDFDNLMARMEEF